MSSLSIKNLVYRYHNQAVIDQLSLTVNSNEIVCLLGASGCGKTTTLKAIAGLIKPESGCIAIADQCISDEHCFLPPEQRNLGMMFQDYALFPHLTVAENIGFGLAKWTKSSRQARVEEMLALIKLPDLANRYPHQLSGGQQQRVAIARALAYKPTFLLLDEPFSNIDHQVRFQLIEEIRQIIKASQVSAIFVTHSKEEAFAFADKLAVMDQGRILQIDEPQALFSHPNSKQVAEFLGNGIYLAASYNNNRELTTELGLLEADLGLAQTEQAGQVYVRPHHLTLEADQQGQHSVKARRFMGEQFFYRVDIAGQEIEIAANANAIFEIGQPVTATLLPHPVNFFAQS